MPEELTETAWANGQGVHPAARAWSQLSGPRGEPTRITTLKDQRAKSAVYRLGGVGVSGGDVIAKRCRRSVAAVERTLYEQVLPRLPLPALRYYGFLGEPAGKFAWLFVEDAGEEPFCPTSPEHLCLAAEWLATLHTSALDLVARVELPDRGPDCYRGEARLVREAIGGSGANPALQPDDRAILRAVDEQLALVESRWGEVEAVCRGMPRTLVHGDYVRKNVRLLATPDGPRLVALDWETAGWGVPAADLCRFVGAPVKPDLDTYCAVMRERGYPLSRGHVEEVAHVGNLFRLISAMYWASLRLGDPWVRKCMVWLRCYRDCMAEALPALRWGSGGA